MIADLFDMRRAGWKSRIKSIGPTTLTKVHKEIAAEENHKVGRRARAAPCVVCPVLCSDR